MIPPSGPGILTSVSPSVLRCPLVWEHISVGQPTKRACLPTALWAPLASHNCIKFKTLVLDYRVVVGSAPVYLNVPIRAYIIPPSVALIRQASSSTAICASTTTFLIHGTLMEERATKHHQDRDVPLHLPGAFEDHLFWEHRLTWFSLT